MKNKKKIIITISIMLLITLTILIGINKKEIKLDEVKLKNTLSYDSKNLSIMIYNNDKSEYEKYTGEGFPDRSQYVYNTIDSGCLNNNGDKINNALNYDAINRKVTVTTRETVHCYMYFNSGKTLTLEKGEGIDKIYYKVNDDTEYSESNTTVSVALLPGNTYSYYVEASNGYKMGSCYDNNTHLCSGTMPNENKTITIEPLSKYNLTLTIDSTSIAKIYYKIEGDSDWSNTTTNKTIQVSDTAHFYVYAESTTDYTYTQYNSNTNYYTGTMTSSGYIFYPKGTLTPPVISDFYWVSTSSVDKLNYSEVSNVRDIITLRSGKIAYYCISSTNDSTNCDWIPTTDNMIISESFSIQGVCYSRNYVFVKDIENQVSLGFKKSNQVWFEICCFEENTEIDVYDEKKKRKIKKKIKYIKKGEYIYCYNEKKDCIYKEKVKKMIVNKTNELFHVYINGEKVSVTRKHPFYIKNMGYIVAEDLKVGYEVAAGNDKFNKIDKIVIEKFDKKIKTYSIVIENEMKHSNNLLKRLALASILTIISFGKTKVVLGVVTWNTCSTHKCPSDE